MNLIEAWNDWFFGKKLPDDTIICAVWCLKLLVWARLAKIIQVVAAATIIADIVGAERLRQFGNSLRSVVPPNTAKRYLTKTMGWLRGVFEPLLKEMEQRSLQSEISFGEISCEEHDEQSFSRLNAEEIVNPRAWQAFESFINWMYRLFQTSSFDKLNIACSVAILLIYTVPFIREIFSSFLDSLMSHRPDLIWMNYLVALITFSFLLFFGFLIDLFFVSPIIVSAIIFCLTVFVAAIDRFIIKGLAWLLELPTVENWIKIFGLILLIVGFHFDLLAS